MILTSLKLNIILLLISLIVGLSLGFTPVTLKLFGIDKVDIIAAHQTSEDIYHNFVFLYPNDQIQKHIVSNGIGTFMNVSYANLFLRVSVDHSLMIIVSEQCGNCGKNVLFNMSHSLTGDIYNFESDDCWSNLFAITSASYAKCEVQLNFGNRILLGLLGYDNIYLSAYSKSFPIENMIFIEQQDGITINENLNGVMGIGRADIDGTFGFSVYENFMSNGVIEGPMFSICIEPIGDGYIQFSAYGNGSYPVNEDEIVWFEQEFPERYTIRTERINFLEWEYIPKIKSVHLTFNTPYLLLPEPAFDGFYEQIKNGLCKSDNFPKICSNIDKLMKDGQPVGMLFEELDLLEQLPVLTLELKGKQKKTLLIETKKYFGVCPELNKAYFYSGPGTEIQICSLVKINRESTDPNQIMIGNIAHSTHGSLYIFNQRAGLVGIHKNAYCYTKNDEHKLITFEYPATFSFISQVLSIVVLFLLLIFALNKCDEYFYEEEEAEGEENLNFLSQVRSENTEQQNQTHVTHPGHTRNESNITNM